MIIIADAHVNKSLGNHIAFFQMLERFAESSEDIIFLGDIFDLWIALPAYEQSIHRRFLDWCRAEKARRTVGFIEGNHEFFLAQERRDAFSWCTDAPWWSDDRGNLFCHGDQINRKDINYFRFRRLVRNRTVKTLLRVLPFGPRLAEGIKQGMKNPDSEFRKHMPWDEIGIFAEDQFAKHFKAVFVGHFHREHHLTNPECQTLNLLPDWFTTGKVARYDEDSGQMRYRHWQELSFSR